MKTLYSYFLIFFIFKTILLGNSPASYRNDRYEKDRNYISKNGKVGKVVALPSGGYGKKKHGLLGIVGGFTRTDRKGRPIKKLII